MKIFLSYGSEDRAVAEQVQLLLVQDGHEVFFDRAALRAGEEYDATIHGEIRASDLFVFLISPDSVSHGRYART